MARLYIIWHWAPPRSMVVAGDEKRDDIAWDSLATLFGVGVCDANCMLLSLLGICLWFFAQ